ncbi:MAG TPA: 4-hydroxythreonine-4-phosphate dehydrogenase PdxA [Kiritimatiellia bacterium]|nr:4-hydroxythreonine-4-phosphate dehydrogenase PdxA [Kiritimatiellia bacterium]
MKRPPRIGICLGDINGIGPEVALKAAAHITAEHPQARLVLIGSRQPILRLAAELHLPAPLPIDSLRPPIPSPLTLWDPTPNQPLTCHPGQIRPDASTAAAAWIKAAVRACLARDLHGIVTAPIAKEGFTQANIPYPGHTEYLAALTRTRNVGMMLFGGPLRVVLATRHHPLSAVPRLLTRRLLLNQMQLLATSLSWLGEKGKKPIAICGLNPHAGEAGTIGREEIDIIAPAVRAAQRQGLPVQGPLPADTVFHRAAQGEFSAVLAMYHDQGLAPLKLIAFDTGVNLTLGLPILRTSPDHGTAFAIAGKNQAHPSSMIQAIRTAITLAPRPNPWKRPAR